MSDIFSAAGNVAGAAIQANAVTEAAQMQVNAAREARNYLFDNLNPQLIGAMAQGQDIERAKSRLALQSQIDPALTALRYGSENQLAQQGAAIGTGIQQQLGQQAAAEALQSGPGSIDLRNRLIDSAMAELKAGASLPPDVQAELVKAGLENSGLVTGSATPQGFGGTMVRKLIGSEALKLQADRQQRAAALASTASNLEAQRQQILGSLFPNLNAVQLQNLAATQGNLALSNQLVPEAGLGGTDIANLWLSRVGATAKLDQSAADAAARGALGVGAAWSGALGAAAPAIGKGLGSAYNTVSGWFGPSTASAASNVGGGPTSDALGYF
jgi:hypothetical protein